MWHLSIQKCPFYEVIDHIRALNFQYDPCWIMNVEPNLSRYSIHALSLSLPLSAGIDHIRGLLGVLPTQPRIWIKHPKKGALPQYDRNAYRVAKNCIIGYLDCFLFGTEQGEEKHNVYVRSW